MIRTTLSSEPASLEEVLTTEKLARLSPRAIRTDGGTLIASGRVGGKLNAEVPYRRRAELHFTPNAFFRADRAFRLIESA